MKIIYIYLNNLGKNTANVNQTLNMVNALAEKAEVYFISSWISASNLDKKLKFLSLEKNFKHLRTPIKLITKNFFLEKITRLLFSISAYIYLKKIYPAFSKKSGAKSDIIVTRDFSFLLFLSMLPHFLKPKQKIIFEPHIIYHRASKKVKLPQEQKALSQAHFFTPISQGVKDDLISLFGIQKEKIKVLPDGVNLNIFKKQADNRQFLAQKYGLAKDCFVIVYTGSFQDWKGVDIIVKSAKYIGLANFKILLIGGTGQQKTKIEKIVKENNLTSRIIIDGFLAAKQVAKILASAHVGVIANKKEAIGAKYTSPLKLFEYMACGLPIVAPRLSFAQEILREGRNCLFFQAENEKDLASKIEELFYNPSLAKKLSFCNIADAQNYSWSKRAQNLLKICTQVINSA